jgi:predicted Zn-ribbon and HTH transcriptional regulator
LNKTPAHRPALHNHQQEAPLVDEPLDDASARAINAQEWEPPSGMVKRQCPRCQYWFAAPPSNNDERCPDCASAGQRRVMLMIARNQ